MKTDIIIDFTNKFLSFESKKIRNEDWEAWEAVRFDVYYQIQDKLMGINSDPITKHYHKKNYFVLFKELLIFISKLFALKGKYIIFAASRFKDKDGLNYDPNILDIYKEIKEDTLIIDNFKLKGKVRYPIVYNRLKDIFNLFYIKIRRKKFPIDIIAQFEYKFGVKLNLNKIDTVLTQYYSEKLFYTIFFRIFKPKAIFITQFGIQKGLFRAANKLNVPLLEFQHGIIYYAHMAYTYPDNIDKKLLAIPNYFLLYSNFWKNKIKDSFPVDHQLVIGNSINSECRYHKIKYNLTFICTSANIKYFIKIVEYLQSKEYTGAICLKLHPQQKDEYQYLKKVYEENPYVEVVYTEISIKDIIGMSEVLLTVQSTSAYEVLDAGKPLIILKKMTYEVHQDIFSDPLVKLVNNTDEILEILHNKQFVHQSNKRTNYYFEPYRKEEAVELLRNIENKNYEN